MVAEIIVVSGIVNWMIHHVIVMHMSVMPHAAGDRVKIAASGVVAVALRVDLLIQHRKELPRMLDAADFFFGRIGVADIDDDSAAADEALPERELELFIRDLVKIQLILIQIEESGAGDEFRLRQKILGEAPRQTEKGALSVLPDIFDFRFLAHDLFLRSV